MHRTNPVIPTVLAAICLSLAFGTFGCGGADPNDPVKKCGGVERNGQCYKLCDESKCAASNYCFKTEAKPEGFCAAPCAAKAECGYGFSCDAGEAMFPDSTAATSFCQSLGLNGNGAPAVACSSDAGCDTAAGLACLGGICTWQCKAIDYCPEGFECRGNPTPPEGALPGYCAPRNADDFVPGRFGTICPTGKSDVCDTAAGYVCSGKLGFCTKADGCTTDEQCPSGYWCGSKLVANGENIDFSKTMRVCLQRKFCAPCETDVDCSFETNAICVPDKNNEKFCSLPCDKESNSCMIGAGCVDAGAGVFACVPDVGVCHESPPKGCSPCRVDTDCGDQSVCMDGQAGYRQAMKWCMTPCGPADSTGKPTCPLAPNGLEMMCLDENQTMLGGPFSSTDPNYVYQHCYAPYTVENTEKYPGIDPPLNICGNYVRDPGEECDDGNSTTTDGCDKCMITPACTFAVQEDKNGDVWTGDTTVGPVLNPAPNHLPATGNDPMIPYVIDTAGSKGCKAFKVTGSLEAAGDVDTVGFVLPNEGYAWLDTYAGAVGECTADLMAEERAWGDNYQTAALNLLNKDAGCKDLGGIMEDMCGSNTLCCGDTVAGKCGTCDDDNGIGACNRMLVTTTTKYANYYNVKHDGKVRLLRIYARDTAVTVPSYTIIFSRFVGYSQQGSSTPVALICN